MPKPAINMTETAKTQTTTMRLTTSEVLIRGMRFHAFHGVNPQERLVGHEFTVDISARCDLSTAMTTDNIAHAPSYADIYTIVKHEMQTPSHLLEHVAKRIAQSIFQSIPAVLSVDITIIKANPPMSAFCDGAGITARFQRQ